MANLISKIAPFERVKFLRAREVQLQSPAQDNLPQLLDVAIPDAKTREFANFLFTPDLTQCVEFVIPDTHNREFANFLSVTDDLPPQSVELIFPDTPTFKHADIPFCSFVDDYLLLSPEQTIALASIPLAYPENKPIVSSDLSQIAPAGIGKREIKDFELSAANSTEIILEILKKGQNIQISNNLLSKLMPPQNVSGILYADKYWRTEKVPSYFGEKADTLQKNNRRNPVRPMDLHKIGRIRVSRPRFRPSFWDLLFVLLQPPLEFNKTESKFLPSDLYPYQVEGVRFLVSNEHALLADDMGTGKTVMTIVALKVQMQSNKIKKALILCPPSVLYEWEQHIADWFPEAVACFVRGSKEIRTIEWDTPAHLYVTSYDTLRSDVDNGILARDKWNSFDVIVVDEAHHIKNSNTDRSRAIRKLKPTYRWALTGTPIQNRLEDLAALFDFIYPKYITSFDLDEEGIKEKVAPYFLRRRKQDVLKDLPPKLKQDIWLEMSDEQSTEYHLVERNIVSEIIRMGGKVTKQHIFAKMQRLKQICNFPSQKNTSPKLEALKEHIEDIIESGSKVVVFSQYIGEGVDKLASALSHFGPSILVGGLSDSSRKTQIDRFRHSDKTPIFLISVRAGGEGLNLVEASYVIHFDHWWNPAVMWQAEDRVHRRGQTQNVNVYSYWMYGTIDERIYEILKSKGLLIQNVVDGLSEDFIEELFTLEDLLKIMNVKNPEKEKPAFDPHKYQNLSQDQIQQRLYEVTPREFEELMQRLMIYLGYPNVRVTQVSHDGGIDVISTRITEKGVERIAAQCKRYKNPVGVRVAREFIDAIQNNKSIVKGYLVTTSEFSSECITYCIQHDIVMINGKIMADYVKRFGMEIVNQQ